MDHEQKHAVHHDSPAHHEPPVHHEHKPPHSTGQESGFANSPLSVPVSILVAGVVIALAVVYSGGSRQGMQQAGTLPQGNNDGGQIQVAPGDLVSGNDAMLGSPDAKVTIVEFSDFQCPFCGRFFMETEPKIIDAYVKTGKVKFYYKHFPFLGNESKWAAQASECAKDQGKFWEFHDYIFNYIWTNYYAKGQNGENVGVFSKNNLKKYANTVGLNASEFAGCLDSGKHEAKIAADEALGRKSGAKGTPTTFVNGKMIVGAQPFEVFDAAIKEALGEK